MNYIMLSFYSFLFVMNLASYGPLATGNNWFLFSIISAQYFFIFSTTICFCWSVHTLFCLAFGSSLSKATFSISSLKRFLSRLIYFLILIVFASFFAVSIYWQVLFNLVTYFFPNMLLFSYMSWSFRPYFCSPYMLTESLVVFPLGFRYSFLQLVQYFLNALFSPIQYTFLNHKCSFYFVLYNFFYPLDIKLFNFHVF